MAGQSLGRIDDTLLVREAQRGNRAAFEELVRHYDQAVLRLAMHLTGSEHEAQDIYQEAFLKAYRNVGNFRFECSFYTWIYRIVTNLCLDHLRKRTGAQGRCAGGDRFARRSIQCAGAGAGWRGAGANPERDLMRRELGGRYQRALRKVDAPRAHGFRTEALSRIEIADRGRDSEYDGRNRKEYFVPRHPETARRAGGHAMTNTDVSPATRVRRL